MQFQLVFILIVPFGYTLSSKATENGTSSLSATTSITTESTSSSSASSLTTKGSYGHYINTNSNSSDNSNNSSEEGGGRGGDLNHNKTISYLTTNIVTTPATTTTSIVVESVTKIITPNKRRKLQQQIQNQNQLPSPKAINIVKQDEDGGNSSTSTTSTTRKNQQTKSKNNSLLYGMNKRSLLTTSDKADPSVTSQYLSQSQSLSSSSSSSSSTTSSSLATKAPSTTSTQTTSTSTTMAMTTTTTMLPILRESTTVKSPSYSTGYINITSQAGSNAYLPCNVKQLIKKKTVSWIRLGDKHIITVNQTVFLNDGRFHANFLHDSDLWSLQIKYINKSDEGLYECQVSTEPKISTLVYLHVVEPTIHFQGDTNQHIKDGSEMTLKCVIKDAIEAPLFVNWFYNQQPIYLPNSLGWQSKIEKVNTNLIDKFDMIASLIIPSIGKNNSGNYTCLPANSEGTTVVVHVHNGESAESASAITSSGYTFQYSIVVSTLISLVTTCRQILI